MLGHNKSKNIIKRGNMFIIIGSVSIFLAFIVAYSTLPYVLMWMVGIPITVIVGVAFLVCAFFLRIKNPDNIPKGKELS